MKGGFIVTVCFLFSSYCMHALIYFLSFSNSSKNQKKTSFVFGLSKTESKHIAYWGLCARAYLNNPDTSTGTSVVSVFTNAEPLTACSRTIHWNCCCCFIKNVCFFQISAISYKWDQISFLHDSQTQRWENRQASWLLVKGATAWRRSSPRRSSTLLLIHCSNDNHTHSRDCRAALMCRHLGQHKQTHTYTQPFQCVPRCHWLRWAACEKDHINRSDR